jgi:hypothetical protein
MAQMLKKIFCLALLTCVAVVDVVATTTIIKPRSQSFNEARWDAGWNSQLYKYDMDETNGSLQLTIGGGQSFRTANLMTALFGSDVTTSNTGTLGCKGSTATLGIQGSGLLTSGTKSATSWLADYFGLSRSFESTVTFKPKISNVTADLNFYLGLDEWAQGLYFRVHAPLVWTKWSLGATESVTNAGTNLAGAGTAGTGFPPGYMGKGTGAVTAQLGIPVASLKSSFLAAMNGTNTFGDMKEALAYGKFNNGAVTVNANGCNTACGLTRTRVSDVEAALGYNFVLDEDYHFGLQLMGSGPAGGRPTAEYVFEPIVGNGGHWTLGGGLTAHATFWRSDCESSSFGFYVDANVTHLFKSCQKRPFDFKNKPNSRYMLLAEHAAQSSTIGATSVSTAGPLATATQYTGNLYHAINKTTLDSNISFGAQGELALKFVYMNGGFSWDLGYDLWARSAEKICLKGSIDTKKYTLKGDAALYGYVSGTGGGGTTGTEIALNVSQSNADIHNGQKGTDGLRNFLRTTAAESDRNFNVDSATAALGGIGSAALNNLPAGADQLSSGADALTVGGATRLSLPAKFISNDDLDTTGAGSVLTNKIFSHIGYAWIDNECWVPFLGLGGEAEFASGNSNSCGTTTTSCGKGGAMSQWNVWLKGGVSF